MRSHHPAPQLVHFPPPFKLVMRHLFLVSFLSFIPHKVCRETEHQLHLGSPLHDLAIGACAHRRPHGAGIARSRIVVTTLNGLAPAAPWASSSWATTSGCWAGARRHVLAGRPDGRVLSDALPPVHPRRMGGTASRAGAAAALAMSAGRSPAA